MSKQAKTFLTSRIGLKKKKKGYNIGQESKVKKKTRNGSCENARRKKKKKQTLNFEST